MSTVALPRQLVAPIPIHGDDRLKSSSVKILAANANSTYSPTSGNRIVFNVPSFSSKVFINPQRSYLSFNIKKTGTAADSRLVDGVPWIDRMTLKMGGVTMVEDLQNYALLERLESLYESSDNAEGRATLTGDFSDVLRKYSNGSGLKAETILDKAIAQQAAGRNYVKPLLSGVIGKGQQFYVPVGMLGGSSQSIQMELFLAPNDQVVTRNTGVTASPGYELSEVALYLEVVELPERAIKIFNSAVLGGGTVKLPYKTVRSFQQHIPSGQTHIDFNIVENSKDCEKVMVALRQQSKVSGYTTADVNGATEDCFALRGGENSGTVLSKYQFRYGTEQFPPAPVEVRDNAGTTPAILHGLSSCDMLNKSTRLTSLDIDGAPVFENNGFFIAQGFKTSDDNIQNGLNTAVGGAPIELKLDLSANNTDISMFAFVRSNYSLNIGTNGSVRMTEGSH
jgi:hypothetical protein